MALQASPQTLPRLRPLTIAVLVLVTAAAYAIARPRHDLVDFAVYRTAASRAIDAAPLYRPEDGHYQFKYWPAFAFVMAPAALIPVEVGKALWFGLSVALLVLLVRTCFVLLPDRRRRIGVLAGLSLLLTGKFIVLELVNGQTNILLATLIMLALAADARGRQVTMGSLIAAAIFAKPYAVVLLPWLAVTRHTRALGAALAVVAVGLVVPAVAYGWDANLNLLRDWARTVAGTTPENLLFPENISYATMWAKWLGPSEAASWLAAATGVAALVVVAVTWWWRRRVEAPDYLEVGLLLALVPLLSPQGWDYVLLIAMPATMLLVDRWPDQPWAWRVAVLAAWACTSFAIFDLWGRSIYLWMMRSGVESVGATILVLAIVSLRRRSLG